MVLSLRFPQRVLAQWAAQSSFVAAAASWFEREAKSGQWLHLVNHYSPLADEFNIILGEIRAEDFVRCEFSLLKD
jgi:hypothetical protein